MAIKKRTNAPKDETVSSASERDTDHDRTRARNPFLTGLRQDVYYFVQANPNCTRVDVARGINLPNNVATARVKELIDEGYLFEPPGHRKVNPSGVSAKVLRVSDRPAGGTPLDKVRIEVTLAIDHNGNYYAHAEVIGGQPQHLLRTKAHTIKRQRITITAPHPDSYKSVFSTKNTDTVSRMETERYADDIIDAEYTAIN